MDEFIDILVGMEQRTVEGLVYLARAQGIPAGVKPYTPQGEDDVHIKRAVFIAFPEKTVIWPYAETEAKFLDSLPQYTE